MTSLTNVRQRLGLVVKLEHHLGSAVGLDEDGKRAQGQAELLRLLQCRALPERGGLQLHELRAVGEEQDVLRPAVAREDVDERDGDARLARARRHHQQGGLLLPSRVVCHHFPLDCALRFAGGRYGLTALCVRLFRFRLTSNSRFGSLTSGLKLDCEKNSSSPILNGP